MEKIFIRFNLSHVFLNCPLTLTKAEKKYYCDEVLIAAGLQDIDDVCEVLEYSLYRFNCIVKYKIGLFVNPRFENVTDAETSVVFSLEQSILAANFDPFNNNMTKIAVGVEPLNASALMISSAIPSPSNQIPLENNYVESLVAMMIIIGFAVIMIIICGYFFFTRMKEREATQRTWEEWLYTHQRQNHVHVQPCEATSTEYDASFLQRGDCNSDDSNVHDGLTNSITTTVSAERGKLSIHTFVPPLLLHVDRPKLSVEPLRAFASP